MIGAGAILSTLPGTHSPEAGSAISAFNDSAAELKNRLFLCSSGREHAERGFGRDVEIAAEFDVSAVVPVLQGDAFISQ